MPIVQVNLVEGRSPEAIAAMIRGVSEAVAESLDAPISAVRVIVNEMAEHQFGIGGDPWPAVRAAREAATAPAVAEPAIPETTSDRQETP